jgi:translation initiation factor 1
VGNIATLGFFCARFKVRFRWIASPLPSPSHFENVGNMTRLFAGTPFDIPPTCEHCGNLEAECSCSAADKAAVAARLQQERDRLPPEKQIARVTVQKRKGGRKATVVEGLTAKANDLPALLKRLQASCGSGGTVKPKEDVIELQGDHVAIVRQSLTELGYRLAR